LEGGGRPAALSIFGNPAEVDVVSARCLPGVVARSYTLDLFRRPSGPTIPDSVDDPSSAGFIRKGIVMRLSRRFRGGLGGVALVMVLMSTGAIPAEGNDDESWAPVTIVYTSDVKGHIEPCG